MIHYLCLAYFSVFFGSQVRCHPDRMHNVLSLSFALDSFALPWTFLNQPTPFPLYKKTPPKHTAFLFSSLFPLKVRRRWRPALRRRAGSSASWVRLCSCSSSCSFSASSREAKVESIQASADYNSAIQNYILLCYATAESQTTQAFSVTLKHLGLSTSDNEYKAVSEEGAKHLQEYAPLLTRLILPGISRIRLHRV